MSDTQISDLFADGTAPESDPVFALGVAAGIGRARLGARLRALALRAAVVLMLAGAVFVAAGSIRPVLVQMVAGAPQFMGVPVFVVMGVLVAGLAVRARAMFWPSGAGVGLLEPIEQPPPAAPGPSPIPAARPPLLSASPAR